MRILAENSKDVARSVSRSEPMSGLITYSTFARAHASEHGTWSQDASRGRTAVTPIPLPPVSVPILRCPGLGKQRGWHHNVVPVWAGGVEAPALTEDPIDERCEGYSPV